MLVLPIMYSLLKTEEYSVSKIVGADGMIRIAFEYESYRVLMIITEQYGQPYCSFQVKGLMIISFYEYFISKRLL